MEAGIGIRELKIDNKVSAIKQTLRKYGIKTSAPSHIEGEQSQGPGEWLLRGTANKTPLFNGRMEPTLGEYGSLGVFFTDNPDKVFTHEEGMIIVMKSDVQGKDWIMDPSPQFEKLANDMAEKHDYDRSTVVGGLSAEEKIFESCKVYQQKKNCATFPSEVGMSKASLILVTPNFLSREDLKKIPSDIKAKIVKFNYSAV